MSTCNKEEGGNRSFLFKRMPRVWDSSSSGQAMSLKSSSSEATPILVNCSGLSETDSSESSDQRESSTGSTGRSSAAGSTAAYTRITAAEMQKGRYKTGVRYCLETWPDNMFLRVRCLEMRAAFEQCCLLPLVLASSPHMTCKTGACHEVGCIFPQWLTRACRCWTPSWLCPACLATQPPWCSSLC